MIDKTKLIELIKEYFINSDRYPYSRTIAETFDQKGNFVGDNVMETIFELKPGHPSIIYQMTGPYDAAIKDYASYGFVWFENKIFDQVDLKNEIISRTGAMVPIFLDTLQHKPKKILLVGPGKVNKSVLEYLCLLFHEAELFYNHHNLSSETFENFARDLGTEVQYVKDLSDLSKFDVIVMATNTATPIITQKNFATIKKGALVFSFYTTGNSAEIDIELYGRPEINLFIDYENTKTFKSDTKTATEKGYFDKSIELKDLLTKKVEVDTRTRVNLIRLTGTPFQNLALYKLLLKTPA